MSTTPPSDPWSDPAGGSPDPAPGGGYPPPPPDGGAQPRPQGPGGGQYPPPPPPYPPPSSGGGYPPYPPPGGESYPPPPPPPRGGYPPYPGGSNYPPYPGGTNYPPPPGSAGGYPPSGGAYPPTGGGYQPYSYPAQGNEWQAQPGVVGGYLAGWWTRVGATIIDWLIVAVVTAIIVAAAGGSGRGFGFSEWGLFFIYSWILLGVPRAQTVGMMALGTRVVDANTGGPIGFARSFGRVAVYFLLGITIIGGILDILWPLWDQRNQTLHDKAIGSVLIRIR